MRSGAGAAERRLASLRGYRFGDVAALALLFACAALFMWWAFAGAARWN